MNSLARKACAAASRGAARARGFSLIELMIALGIVGILAAVGYPSYVAYIQRANRVAAKAALVETAQHFEREFTTKNAYPTALPALYSFAPISVPVSQRRYGVALQAGSTTTAYVLVATPNNAKVDPTCGVLRLDNVGNQRANDHAVTAAAVDSDVKCWQQ